MRATMTALVLSLLLGGCIFIGTTASEPPPKIYYYGPPPSPPTQPLPLR